MTTILLVRHGESQANKLQIFCGQSDYDLTEAGVLQAQGTAAHIASAYAVDHVYASTLSRAYRTGEAIAARTGAPFTPDERLREIHCGEWEEAAFGEMLTRWPDSYPLWLHDIGNCQCPGGESMTDVVTRVLPALTEYAERHASQTVVAATHGGVIRAMVCVLSGRPLSEMKNIPWAHNASVTECIYENGVWRLGRVDDDRHLGALSTSLPDTV